MSIAWAAFVYSDSPPISSAISQPFIAEIKAHSTLELSEILQRVDQIVKSESRYSIERPVSLILHGSEIRAFLKENYENNEELVNLAAQLQAFNAIDIQVCETWMKLNDVDRAQLPPFVSTVPYGPAVEANLLDQGYEYF
ncbi:hypothetical protein QWZ13_03445 [Reinekea marina]|uniref:Intracellular sulfur oxidation DsrE/DsrF family protein n=1 Tax=Reinekea marina TaxID=1310421 RepID=A0ABV7WV26_9GAMM|nr:hypothetical protein [Reinekea marina]MDN3647967.1 hypothetical protein [Reinekea marina]